MVHVTELLDLVRVKASKAEHANLVCDVVPGSRGVESLKLGAQGGAHVLDTVGHGEEVLLPLSKELLVVQDGRDNASSVQRRVGDLNTLKEGELRGDSGDGGFGIRAGAGNEVEAASTLTVETKVLGETLRNDKLEALLDEVANRGSIASKAATGEALVGAVEEGEVVLAADDGGKLLPLLKCRVDTGRVVGARVKENNGTLRRLLDAALHALEVEAASLLVEVRVVGALETDILEDGLVVGPSRVGNINLGTSLVEFGEEESTEVDGTGTGDGLDRGHTLLLDGERVGAEHELSSLGGEIRSTSDRAVFVVEASIVAENFIGLEPRGQHA